MGTFSYLPINLFMTTLVVDIFPERWRPRDGNVESFAEMQASFAKAAVEAATQVGVKLFQLVQGSLAFYAW